MKNKLIKSSIGLALALVALAGCNDADFLTEKPRYFYTPDNVFSTPDQVDQAVMTCYTHVRRMYNMDEENNNYFVFRGGNGTDMFDVATIRLPSLFNNYGALNPQRGEFTHIYARWYELISKANLALYAAELPQITWDSQQDKSYTVAQARFFRAFAYRNLAELYGGVPILTEVVTVPRYDYERASRVDTYQFAIDELEAILDDLPETTATAGRLVRGAAQHTLCQLYLDKGIALEEEGKSSDAKTAYDKAVSYGDVLIDGSQYKLMTERFGTRKSENPVYYYANTVAGQTADRTYASAGIDIEGNVYWDLFQEGNQDFQLGNTEAIWVAQVDFTAYKAEDGQSKLQYSRVFGPVFRDPMSWVVSGELEDVGGRGIVQTAPTMYTRDIVYEGKWGADMRNSEAVFRRTFLGNIPKFTFPDNHPTHPKEVIDNPYYGKVVPWDVLYRKGNHPISGVSYDKSAVDAAVTQVFPISCKIHTDKYTGLAQGENRSNLFRDEYLIRLSETILLRAEAKMRGGNSAGAAEDINLLRARAKCGYMVTAADVNVDLILDERARELVYEETRWNTLLRMGGTVAVDRIKKYAYWDDARTTLTKNFNLWPIPQSVIDTNKDVPMAQNPGW